MAEQRDFKGVWIPRTVWLDGRLTALDKVILTEIDSLDMSERGCYASNKHIAEFCQCSETKVSKSISQLVKYGYLYVKSFDGRQRELKSRLANYESQPCKKYKADMQKVQESNTENKTVNKSVKESKKATSGYDEIINTYTDNEELKQALYEFIKMRKFIKAPLTDNALKLITNKLDKLSNGNDNYKIDCLNQSIENSWKGIFELKNQNQPQSVQQKINAKRQQDTEENMQWLKENGLL